MKRNHSNEFTRRRILTRLAWAAAWTVAAAPVIDAAPIIWDPATTISADADIMTAGGLVYAYNASNTNQTVNGVTFTGVSSQTAWGTGVSLNLAASPGNNASAFDDGGWGAFGGGASYKAMLAGASYNGGAAATITLNTLTSGHRYATQFWVNDTRTSGSGRTETATSTGGNTITLDYNNTNAAGGVGQFGTGVFLANAATQAFTIDGNTSSQINAIQVRDVTNLGYWVGTGGATWDASTTANFANNLWSAALATTTFNTAKTTLGSVVFADSYWNSGTANAVTQNSVTIAAGGVSTGNVFFDNSSALAYTVTSSDANGITGGTKVNVTGGGTVTLAGTHSYSGGTHIGSGTLQIGNAGTTGTMGSGAVSNSGTLVFNRTNTYTLASGNLVTGAGAVTLANTGAVATSVDNQFNTTGALNFGATNGSTTVSSLDLSNGGSSFGSLNVVTNSASANTITIGAGRTLNISGAVSIGASSGTTNLTLTGASGTLAVNNGGGATNNNFYIGGGGTATGTLNMSGLGTFNANLGTGTFAVGNGSTNGSGSVPFTAILGTTSTISATKVSVGGGFGNTTNASAYTLRLGSGTNTINTADLYVGVFNNQGRGNVNTTLNFNTTTGTLTLRGLAGGSTRANVHIGENQGGSTGTASGGRFDLGGSASTGLSGGNADLMIDVLTISRRTAGSNDTSSMTFRSGVLDVNTLTMGNSTGGNSATSTLTLNGGSVTFNTAVSLGLASGTGTGNATMNVAGATVTSTPGLVMGNRTNGTVNSTVNISAGSLTLGGDITTVGDTNTTLTLSGGTLDLGGNNIGTALASIDTFTINPATAAELKNVGSINGTAGITKIGAGTLTLNANNYSGPTAISAGTVLIDGANDLGDSSATNTISLNASTLRSTANSYDLGINRAVTLAGAGTIQSDVGTLTVSGDVTTGANALTLIGDGNIAMTGVIGAGATPTGGLTIGSSTVGANVTLSGNNLFTGNVAFGGTNTQPQGKLTITHSGALGVGPKTVTATSSTGATGGIHLQNNITLAANISITSSGFAIYNDSGSNTVNGNFTMAAGNGNTTISSTSGLLTLNGNFSANTTGRNLELKGDGDGVINGVISNGSTAAMEVRKNSGTGSWTLSGDNTYTGATIVSAGTLVINGDQSAATGAVSIASGATLGGSGTIGGAMNVTGILAPGNSIGTLTVTNDVTWVGAASASSATDWQFELGLGTADLLDITGISSDFLMDDSLGSIFRFDFLNTGITNDTYTLVSWDNITDFSDLDFTYTNLASGKTGSFAIVGSSLQFTVVPEPGSMLLGLLGSGLLLRRRRKSI
jgi:autotransporter-associated beta strand protein